MGGLPWVKWIGGRSYGIFFRPRAGPLEPGPSSRGARELGYAAAMKSAPRPSPPGVDSPFGGVISFLCTFWLGLVAGVTFLATPVKFLAPSLDRPTALDVGRATFRAFSLLEWALFAVLSVATWRAWASWRAAAPSEVEERPGASPGNGSRDRPSGSGARAIPVPVSYLWLSVGLVLLVQGAWVLPALDARVALVLAGEPLPPSPMHTAYGLLELLKCALLVAWGWVGSTPRRALGA